MRSDFTIRHQGTIHKVGVYPDHSVQETIRYAAGAYVIVEVNEVGDPPRTLMLKKGEARAIASAMMGAAADLGVVDSQR